MLHSRCEHASERKLALDHVYGGDSFVRARAKRLSKDSISERNPTVITFFTLMRIRATPLAPARAGSKISTSFPLLLYHPSRARTSRWMAVRSSGLRKSDKVGQSKEYEK